MNANIKMSLSPQMKNLLSIWMQILHSITHECKVCIHSEHNKLHSPWMQTLFNNTWMQSLHSPRIQTLHSLWIQRPHSMHYECNDCIHNECKDGIHYEWRKKTSNCSLNHFGAQVSWTNKLTLYSYTYMAIKWMDSTISGGNSYIWRELLLFTWDRSERIDINMISYRTFMAIMSYKGS